MSKDDETGNSLPRQTPSHARSTLVWPRDGKTMVKIGAGSFLFGEDRRQITTPAYWIDRTPVTNADYRRFLLANPSHPVPRAQFDWAQPYNWDPEERVFPAGKAQHPVVLVTWHNAEMYASWAGKRLPTEMEWERAARGAQGRVYPWGDVWKPGCCNTREAGVGGTTTVGRFSPQGDGPTGCVDMAGNVWEWTASWWNSAKTNRVVKGGSWSANQVSARTFYRYYYVDRSDYVVGFRTVVTTP